MARQVVLIVLGKKELLNERVFPDMRLIPCVLFSREEIAWYELLKEQGQTLTSHE